ncbi:MAG: Na+/H+ antiporter NhaA, partial [Novosphingobium sp.]|nr:Na+/H+ antiporter NhaA [Novosphingobium sp.]
MAGNLGSGAIRRKLSASEAAPGLVLMACAAAALALANSPLAHAWHDLFLHPLPWSPVSRLANLHEWINDGLMAVFFLVVGLEIKREFVMGALSDKARRRLPVIAALAGMAAPALVYLAVTNGHPVLRSGWAIPAATDIAFALGVLALLGSRVPPSVRLFLLTVAVVDDIGAIAVIALFYTASLQMAWLMLAIALFAAMALLNRFGVRALPPYLALAAALWFAVLHSGIHATVAGVLAAFTIPVALDRHGDSPLLRLEHALVGASGFIIV